MRIIKYFLGKKKYVEAWLKDGESISIRYPINYIIHCEYKDE